MVSNITNLSEARYCAGMGVQFLAYPAHLVNPKMYQDITSWLQGPEMVLDVSNIAEVSTLLNEYRSGYILLSADQFQRISDTLEVPAMVKIDSGSIRLANELSKQTRLIRYIVTEGLSEEETKYLKSIGFSLLHTITDNNGQSIEELLKWPIDGIVLIGNPELKPGLMDYSHLSEMLENLEMMEE